MTNNKAIELLDNLLGVVEDNHGSDYDKAIHMAIDALTADMDDLISRQAAIDIAYPFDDNERNLIDALEDLPTADVRENVRGEWIKGQELSKKDIKRPYLLYWYYCSQCKEEAYCDTDYGQQLFDFCPNCGADMRGDKT